MVTTEEVISLIGTLPGVDLLIKIFQVAGIAIAVYFIFLIFKIIFQYRYTRNVSHIARDVEQINKKMDLFLRKEKKK